MTSLHLRRADKLRPTIRRQHRLAPVAFALFAGCAPHSEPITKEPEHQPVGRYAVSAEQGSRPAILVDTATGETWYLVKVGGNGPFGWVRMRKYVQADKSEQSGGRRPGAIGTTKDRVAP